jgi:hypothetical protein
LFFSEVNGFSSEVVKSAGLPAGAFFWTAASIAALRVEVVFLSDLHPAGVNTASGVGSAV